MRANLYLTSYFSLMLLEKAKAQTLYYEKDLDLCVKVMPSASDKTGNYPKGKHVLTLVTPPKKQVIFAWLLTPP
jgi:hypothetical protein